MNLGALPPLEFCEIVWKEVLILRMFGKIHLWSHLVQGFCLLGFSFPASISLGINFLFRFSDSFWFSFGRLCVSKKVAIWSRFCSLLAYSCSSYFLTILYISLVSVIISPLSFLILFVWVLFLWVWLKVCQSCLSYQRTSSFVFLLDFISFISVLISIIAFLLLILGFVCCTFSSSFKCEVRLFIWAFSFLR